MFFGSGRRGRFRFLRISKYPYEEKVRKKHENAVVELAVNYAVKDISKFTTKVEEWKGNGPLRVIWCGNRELIKENFDVVAVPNNSYGESPWVAENALKIGKRQAYAKAKHNEGQTQRQDERRDNITLHLKAP